MFNLRSLIVAAIAFLGVAFVASSALAANPPCGVSGATVTSLGNYDPFNPSTINNINVNIQLTRFTNGNGAKTQRVDFYFVQPAGSPAYQINYNGFNVLYNAPYTGAPTLDATSPPNGTVGYNFLGTSQPDTVNLPFTITIPTGVDLSAGLPIIFDIRYICDGTGQMSDVLTPTILPQVITLNVTVLSALQASYVGSALDFGEVGTLSNATVLGAPATYTRSGNIRVASSGPYTVALHSNNGFRMTYAGGSTAINTQALDYSLTFLGSTRSPANTTDITRNCQRAGLSGQQMPISAILQEGGQGNVPSPAYIDTLAVTVTPVTSLSGQLSCP